MKNVLHEERENSIRLETNIVTWIARRIKHKFNTPLWYILMVLLVIVLLVSYFMVFQYVRIVNGFPIDAANYPNMNIGEKLPVVKEYALNWSAMDIASLFVCLFLGLVCLLMGIARSMNKLESKRIYAQALFLLLFAINNMSMVKITGVYIQPQILFYTYWITFFTYPIALFVYFYNYFAPDFQKWTWPLLVIPAAYGAAALFMFLFFGLPFDIPAKYYTEIAAGCFILFLLVGLFGVNQKSMTWFIRSISGFWISWACYYIVKAHLGYPMELHNEFKNGLIISAVVIVCFLVFFNMQELAQYRSDMQLLSMQNRLAKESYEHIKVHLKEVGGLKHEMRTHIVAMQMYLKDGRYEEAESYLAKFSAQTNWVTEVIYHDNYLVNAVVGNLLHVAREQDIKVELNLNADAIHMAEPDLYSLLNNILHNALTACGTVPEGHKRFIHLTITKREPYLYIACKNSKYGEVLDLDGTLQTTKPDVTDHGFGLWIISRIVEAYNGMMDTEYDESTFTITAAIKDYR